jgi:DNA-nicking Smr family endonuclease
MARRRALHPAFDALAKLRKPQTKASGKALSAPPAPDVSRAREEQALFKAAMQDVRALPAHGKADIERPKPQPLPRQRLRDENDVLSESLRGALSAEDRLDMEGTENAFSRPGLPRHALADLRRGRWVIQAELDLHGFTREDARHALNQFLLAARAQNYRCVRVIHGKGLSSPGGKSVLKILSRQWLAQREEVLAFCQPRPRDGGEGALLVLLRSAVKAP